MIGVRKCYISGTLFNIQALSIIKKNMNRITDFEIKYRLELPQEIKFLIAMIEDGYDYESFYFNWENEDFLLLRGIYSNDSEIVELAFPELDNSLNLAKIIQEKTGALLEKLEDFYVFAYSPRANQVLGYFYTEKKFEGVYKMTLNEERNIKRISNEIEGVLFNHLSNDHEFRFYQSFTQIKFEQEKLSSPKFIQYPEESVFLYQNEQDIEIEFYTDILKVEEYFITDSEWFDGEDSYIELLNNLNQITKNDCQFLSSLVIKDQNVRVIELSKKKIQSYLGELKSDYVNPNFFEFLNHELDKVAKIEKRFIQFWDVRFGQEIGIAFIEEEKEERIKIIGTAKVYDFVDRQYK